MWKFYYSSMYKMKRIVSFVWVYFCDSNKGVMLVLYFNVYVLLFNIVLRKIWIDFLRLYFKSYLMICNYVFFLNCYYYVLNIIICVVSWFLIIKLYWIINIKIKY